MMSLAAGAFTVGTNFADVYLPDSCGSAWPVNQRLMVHMSSWQGMLGALRGQRGL